MRADAAILGSPTVAVEAEDRVLGRESLSFDFHRQPVAAGLTASTLPFSRARSSSDRPFTWSNVKKQSSCSPQHVQRPPYAAITSCRTFRLYLRFRACADFAYLRRRSLVIARRSSGGRVAHRSRSRWRLHSRHRFPSYSCPRAQRLMSDIVSQAMTIGLSTRRIGESLTPTTIATSGN